MSLALILAFAEDAEDVDRKMKFSIRKEEAVAILNNDHTTFAYIKHILRTRHKAHHE